MKNVNVKEVLIEMKLKVDACLSTGKEFYGTIYPESEEEENYLSDMIDIHESEKIKIDAKGAKKE